MLVIESSPAARPSTRRDLLRTSFGLAAAGLLVSPGQALAAVVAPRAPRELSFLNLHTGERLKAEYWRNGQYDHQALSAISHLLRDHRNNQVHAIDPALLDLIHILHDKVRSADPFHVISGYRSPASNALMHELSCGVAKNSMHVQGKAIDIRLPGTGLRYLQSAALSLHGGGVGFYPKDDFVHVDTGKIRRW